MSSPQPLSGPMAAPASGNMPKQLVILLHGLGADGNDLIGLSQAYGQLLPDAAFVAPNAPFACDMAPMGHQWFSFQDRKEEAVRAGIETAMPMLNAYIDQQMESLKLTADKVALVGFSQGCMMSLYTAPRRATPIAGVVGYSGRLFGGDDLDKPGISRMPILLAHGAADDIVPPVCLPEAMDGLMRAGFPVTALSRPGVGHGIDEESVRAGAIFLARQLENVIAG